MEVGIKRESSDLGLQGERGYRKIWNCSRNCELSADGMSQDAYRHFKTTVCMLRREGNGKTQVRRPAKFKKKLG